MTDASITKFWLKNRLSAKLSVSDPFLGEKTGNRLYFDRMTSLQRMESDSRRISLTLRYRFNPSKNKYKGTSAAPEEVERL